MFENLINRAFQTLSFYFYKNNVGKEKHNFVKIFNFPLITIRKGDFDTMGLQLRVSEYLAENGIKKKHLASIIGIYPSQLSQWLSGEYVLNANQIKLVEDFLSGKSQ